MLQHCAQILGVEQQQAVGVGNAEHQVEHALLGVVQLQHARQQQRPHMRDRGAHRVALLAEHVPQRGRARAPRRLRQVQVGQALLELVRELAGLRDAGQITFDVRHKDRHAQARKPLRQRLQRDGLARSGGAGDQPVPVAHLRQQHQFMFGVLGDEDGVGHDVPGYKCRGTRHGSGAGRPA
ncbi:hypothetical protein D3C72_1652180 [compost metagenome]